MESARQLRTHAFHGLRLGCLAERSVLTALEARLHGFVTLADDPADALSASSCDVLFEYRNDDAAPDPLVPETARVIYESPVGRVLYNEATDRIFLRSSWPISAVCDPKAGKVVISTRGEAAPHLWALTHPMFTIPLIEILKRRGRYSLHAAGVAGREKGLLIAGSSGSGKSTLALALSRAGFGFLGDDLLFLAADGEELAALAFPEAFDLTEDTLRFFPELVDLLAQERAPGWPKRMLRADRRYRAPIVPKCKPNLVLFPCPSRTGVSALYPLDSSEALMELLPNILLTEAASSQRHLDTLGRLVRSTPCYRLETGTDFSDLAATLGRMLEAA